MLMSFFMAPKMKCPTPPPVRSYLRHVSGQTTHRVPLVESVVPSFGGPFFSSLPLPQKFSGMQPKIKSMTAVNSNKRKKSLLFTRSLPLSAHVLLQSSSDMFQSSMTATMLNYICLIQKRTFTTTGPQLKPEDLNQKIKTEENATLSDQGDGSFSSTNTSFESQPTLERISTISTENRDKSIPVASISFLLDHPFTIMLVKFLKRVKLYLFPLNSMRKISDVELMPDKMILKKNILYIKKNVNLKYAFIDTLGEVKIGHITHDQLGCEINDPIDLDELRSFLPSILKIISKSKQGWWKRFLQKFDVFWVIDTLFKSIFLAIIVKLIFIGYLEEDKQEVSEGKHKLEDFSSHISSLIISYDKELYTPHTRAFLSYHINRSESINKHDTIERQLEALEEKLKDLQLQKALDKCSKKRPKFVFEETISGLESLIGHQKRLELLLKVMLVMNEALSLHYNEKYKESYDRILSMSNDELSELKKITNNHSDDYQPSYFSQHFIQVVINFYNLKGIFARVYATREENNQVTYSQENPNKGRFNEAEIYFKEAIEIGKSISTKDARVNNGADNIEYSLSLVVSNLGFVYHDLARCEKIEMRNLIKQCEELIDEEKIKVEKLKIEMCKENWKNYRRLAYEKHTEAAQVKSKNYTRSAIMNGVADALRKVDVDYLIEKDSEKYKKENVENIRYNEIESIYAQIEAGDPNYGGDSKCFTPVMRLNRASFYMKMGNAEALDKAIKDVNIIKESHGKERKDVYRLSAKARFKRYIQHPNKDDCKNALSDIDYYFGGKYSPDAPDTYNRDQKARVLQRELKSNCSRSFVG